MKNHIQKTASNLLILSTCLASVSLSAQTVFEDDFNSYTVGGGLPASTSGDDQVNATYKWWGRDNTTGKTNRIQADSANVFGEGTSNNVLHSIRDNTTTTDLNVTSRTFGPALTGSLTFDYYVADAGDIVGTRGFRVSLVNDGAVENNPFVLNNNYTLGAVFIDGTHVIRKGNSSNLDTGNQFAYTAGQKNTISIVFNNSASTLNYDATSVASGNFDIYLNGTIAGTWALSQGTNVPIGTGVNGLWFQTPNGTVADIQLDNINVTAIPEPSTLSFVGVIVLAGFLRRRRA